MRTLMMKTLLAATVAMALPAGASAAITLASVTPGTGVYSGPLPTYDFETPAPVSGGLVTTGNLNGIRAQPFGSTGNYFTVGPSDGSPGLVDLSAIGNISNVSFLWGSVDAYNLLEFLDVDGNVLASFTGSDIFNPANGSQTDPNLNPVVRFNLTDGSQTAFTTLRLSSSSNAFETDNFAINAVPEPATWALMMIGFAAVGFGMRRRRPQVTARYA